MRNDNRLWVQDHYTKVWHFYLSGHFNYSLCGKLPISGSPLCWYTKPSWLATKDYEDPIVCDKCVRNIENVPSEILDAYNNLVLKLSKIWEPKKLKKLI